MKHIVLIGGTGYLGQEVLRQWLALDAEARFWLVSRSGNTGLTGDRITNLKADFSTENPGLEGLPSRIDVLVNFLGRPANSPEELTLANEVPVRNQIQLAEDRKVPVLGFVGGVLGPKSFVQTKAVLIQRLKQTGRKVAVVEPTLIYGRGRSDVLANLVPVFRFLGLFSKGLKPVRVEAVAAELIRKLTEV